MAAFMGGDAAGVARALPRQRGAPVLPRYAESVMPLASPTLAPAANVLPPGPATAVAPKAVAPAAALNGSNGASHLNGSAALPLLNGANGSHAIAAPATNGTNGAAEAKDKAAGAELSRDKLTDMLLAIVEEKTGYPRDMVGLEQSLESDLGIDSIKRIEVVGAMLQALPERYREALSASRSKLNTQATLEGMLSMMSAAGTEGAISVPFDVAGTETQAVQSLPSRHVIAAEAESIAASALRRITTGHFLITEDGLGLAALVAALLAERGCASTVVPGDVLCGEDRLAGWIAERGAALDSVAGVIHLAAAGAPWLDGTASLAEWRGQLVRNEKSLFILLRGFIGRMAADAHVLSLSTLGGLFGRSAGEPRGLCLQGGAVGLLKSLREERPRLRVKAVDVDPARPLSSLAAELLQELELVGGRQEVGYPDGLRTVFRTVLAPSIVDTARRDSLRALVVLATGGARGVTAETLRELAVPGNTLILTGRSSLVDEPAALAACADAEQGRQRFIAEVRSGASML